MGKEEREMETFKRQDINELKVGTIQLVFRERKTPACYFSIAVLRDVESFNT